MSDAGGQPPGPASPSGEDPAPAAGARARAEQPARTEQPAGTAPREREEQRRRSNRTLLLLFVGNLGFLAALTAVVLALNPTLRRQARERITYGTVSENGLLLELHGTSPRRLDLTFRNVGDAPRSLLCPGGDEAGAEVDVLVKDAHGVEIPQTATSPGDVATLVTPTLLDLAPGATGHLRLDLERFVKLPGPGRYRVTVERARLGQAEPRLRSNELALRIE